MTTTDTTDNHPLLDEYDLHLIKEGHAKVQDLCVLEGNLHADELSDELSDAIEEAEHHRDELYMAYEKLMKLIG